MLEQVWKNIAGGDFPALVSDKGVQILIGKGCQYRIGDFTKLISRVEEALEKPVCVKFTYVGNGELRGDIFIDEPVDEPVQKKPVQRKKVETPKESEQEE